MIQNALVFFFKLQLITASLHYAKLATTQLKNGMKRSKINLSLLY